MNKKIKDKFLANKVLSIGLILGIALTCGIVALSYSGTANTVIENADTVNIDNPATDCPNCVCELPNMGDNPMLGGSTSASWTIGGDLTVGDDVTITGNNITFNGIKEQLLTDTYGSATAGVGTSTLFYVANPFSATGTAFIEYLEHKTGSSSQRIRCGTSTLSSIASSTRSKLSTTLVTDVLTATSAAKVRFRSSITATSVESGYTDPGAKSSEQILWRSNENIVCWVEQPAIKSLAQPGGIGSSTNITYGSYVIRAFQNP